MSICTAARTATPARRKRVFVSLTLTINGIDYSVRFGAYPRGREDDGSLWLRLTGPDGVPFYYASGYSRPPTRTLRGYCSKCEPVSPGRCEHIEGAERAGFF